MKRRDFIASVGATLGAPVLALAFTPMLVGTRLPTEAEQDAEAFFARYPRLRRRLTSSSVADALARDGIEVRRRRSRRKTNPDVIEWMAGSAYRITDTRGTRESIEHFGRANTLRTMLVGWAVLRVCALREFDMSEFFGFRSGGSVLYIDAARSESQWVGLPIAPAVRRAEAFADAALAASGRVSA